MLTVWFLNEGTLYDEYQQRLQNIDDAYELGLYDSEEDRDSHKDRVDIWFNSMHDEMQGNRAA